MTEPSAAFFNALDGRLERYNLLKHPFYEAWSRANSRARTCREYASEYWHHVSAFLLT